MRPLSLELENIGPFVERTVIDFGNFGSNSLFLICGRTGSGKSFLFDSICYALYGETPSGREANLRSDHCRDTDRPRIVFGFSMGDEVFHVERNLSHKDVRQRGAGYRDVAETQCLRRLAPRSEVLATKKTEVNKACKDIIQLELDQFSRVMMIPQGEFRELLRADTERREKLLRKLFRSDLYQDIIREIDEGFRERNGRYLDMSKETRTLLSQFADRVPRKEGTETGEVRMEDILSYREWVGLREAKSREDLNEHCMDHESSRQMTKWMEDAQRLESTRQELMAQHQRLIEKSKDEIDPLRTTLERHELASELSSSLKLLADRACKVERMLEALDENGREKEVLDNELAEASKGMETIPALKARYESVLSSQGRVDPLLDDLARSKVLKKELADGGKKVKELDRDLSGSLSKESRLSEELKQLGSELTKLSEPVTDLDASSAKKTVVHDLIDVMGKRARLRPKLDTMGEQLAVKAREIVSIRKQLEGLKRLREGSLAYELASGLKPGEGCPVCGSDEHPHPAEPPAGVVTKEELEAAEKGLEMAVDEIDRLRDVQVKWQTEFDGYEQRMGEMASRYPELSGLETPVLEHMEGELLRAMDAERERFARAEELRKRQTVMNGRLAELVDERSRRQIALEALRTKNDALAKQLAELSCKVEGDLKALSLLFPGETDPVRLVKAVKGEKERLSLEIETIENMFKRVSDSLLAVSSRMGQLRSDLQTTQRELTGQEEELSRKMAAPRYSVFKGRSEVEASFLDDGALKSVKDRISSHESEMLGLKGSLEQKEKEIGAHLGDRPLPSDEDLWKQRSDEKAKKDRLEEVRSRLSHLEHEAKELDRALERVEVNVRTMRDMEPDLAILKELSDQVKGLGRPRLSLERFFLAQRFEEVLIAANTRLSKLSEGRFVLKRQEEGTTGGQSRAGLDISVFDNITGTERPANSMSGGQMFLASLALALGLADVVMARSGGIRMDALFIDEGFGSLDDETLQLALKVLTELRNDRMVGVISHVQELKRQIPQRIEVVPAAVGSKVRMTS